MVAKAPACPDRLRDEFERHALWLVSAISWIPDKEGPVRTAENYQQTETLLEIGSFAIDRGFPSFAENVSGLLIMWAVKGGRFGSGWGTLETALSGAAALAVLQGRKAVESFKTKAPAKLLGLSELEDEVKRHASMQLQQRATRSTTPDYEHTRLEIALGDVDRDLLDPLLLNLAEIVSPNGAAAASPS